jgi:hypothetical protein
MTIAGLPQVAGLVAPDVAPLPPHPQAVRAFPCVCEWARQDSNLRPRDYESPALTN